MELDLDADINAIGTVRILESCVEHGVRRVHFGLNRRGDCGSPQTFPAAGDHPRCLVSPNGIPELAAERYLFYCHVQRYGVSHAALRYANDCGPRQARTEKLGW